jgi:hypothetical protein
MRPRFQVTEEKRELVITLSQANVSQSKIAAAIGASKKTLLRYFARELSGFFPDGKKAGKKIVPGKNNRRLALRQQVSITCPECLAVIKLIEQDWRTEARIARSHIDGRH